VTQALATPFCVEKQRTPVRGKVEFGPKKRATRFWKPDSLIAVGGKEHLRDKGLESKPREVPCREGGGGSVKKKGKGEGKRGGDD